MIDDVIEGLQVDSDTVKFVNCNFHRPDQLEKMENLLSSNELPAAVILSGMDGIGREYFLDSSIFKCGIKGEHVNVAGVDLEGCEPDLGTLPLYVGHFLKKHNLDDKGNIAKSLGFLGTSVAAGVTASIALSVNLSENDVIKAHVIKAIDKISNKSSESDTTDIESLLLFIRVLTEDTKMVLHIENHSLLTCLLKKELLKESENNNNLLIAFSFFAGEKIKDVVPEWGGSEIPRFEINPLEMEDLREVINELFLPNNFPDDLLELLLKYSHGVPGIVASKVWDLENDGVIFKSKHNDGVCWEMSEGGISSDKCIFQFSTLFSEEVDRFVDNLSEKMREQVQSFLYLAAICGDNIPVLHLMDHIGVTEKDRDDFIDLIDENLMVETDIPIFRDYQYSHPSFAEHIMIYGFRDSVMQRFFLDRLIARDEQHCIAFHFFEFFTEHLPVVSRGAVALFARLAIFIEKEDEEDIGLPYVNMLDWWVSENESELMCEYLDQALTDERIYPEALWNFAGSMTGHVPPYRILVFLEALGRASEAGRVKSLTSDYYYLKATTLGVMKRPDEALNAAQNGLELVEDENYSATGANLYSVIGNIHIAKGEGDEAVANFEKAVTISKKIKPDSLYLSGMLDMFARVLASVGKRKEELEVLKDTLAINRKHKGDNSAEVADILIYIGDAALDIKDHKNAEPALLEGVAIYEKMLASHNELTNAHSHLSKGWYLLATVKVFYEKYEAAEELFNRVMEMEKGLRGADHINVGLALQGLAGVEVKKGKAKKAIILYEKAMKIFDHKDYRLHKNAVDCLIEYADLLGGQGRKVKSEKLKNEAGKRVSEIQSMNS